MIYFFDKQGNVLGKRRMFDEVRHLTLSPDGKLAAMASRGDVVKTVTVEKQRGNNAPVKTVTVPVKYDSTFVFDTAAGSLIHSLAPRPLYTSKVMDLAIANNGNLLVTSTLRRGRLLKRYFMTVQLMNVEGAKAWEAEWEIQDGPNIRYGLAESGRLVIEVDSRGAVVVYD